MNISSHAHQSSVQLLNDDQSYQINKLLCEWSTCGIKRCLHIRRMLRIIFIFLLSLMISISAAVAGTTGKISGKVVDKENGSPLPGVNIQIVGENLGAVTDFDGYFVILQVKPGTYSLKASIVGYSGKIVEGVIVRADLTTEINFQVSESSIAIGEVVVQAEKTMINKDVTSRTSIITSQTFSDLPVVSFQEVVGLQAGIVTGSDGALHARGGRGGEVAYLIDGVPVRDPLSGNFSGQVDKYAIEELQVLTGGFNAEYGQALSGVVNIVTKEGGKELGGRIEYIFPQLIESPYHKADALALDEWGKNTNGKFVTRVDARGDNLVSTIPSAYTKQTLDNTPDLFPNINMLGQFSTVLNGPMPFIPDIRFFLTGRFENTLSQLPWGYNKTNVVLTKSTLGTKEMVVKDGIRVSITGDSKTGDVKSILNKNNEDVNGSSNTSSSGNWFVSIVGSNSIANTKSKGADYEVRFTPTGSFASGLTGHNKPMVKKYQVPYEVWNVTATKTPTQINTILIDKNNSNKFDLGEEIRIVNSPYFINADTTGIFSLLTWFLSIQIDTANGQNNHLPLSGESFKITTYSQLTAADTFSFTVTAPFISTSKELIANEIKKVRVVPNPFIVNAKWEQIQNNRLLKFINLPPECSISIYTVRGELVRRINHTNRTGDEDWNLTNQSSVEVAYGLYIYVVETPDGEKTIGKFAIIK